MGRNVLNRNDGYKRAGTGITIVLKMKKAAGTGIYAPVKMMWWMTINGFYLDLLLKIYCPSKEASMGSIVVSLPCTTYLCGSFITFYFFYLKL